jgi:NADH:ubiquinone oxidoreductase subunit 6 (subunit J)
MPFSEAHRRFRYLDLNSLSVQSKLDGLPLPPCRSSVFSVAMVWLRFHGASIPSSRMIAFAVIALFTLATAAVAVSLRNLIHSALLLVASWAGIAAFYLWAGAEFVAFAQVLIYVGAISMIVLFAVLLTRQSRADLTTTRSNPGRGFAAALLGVCIFGVLATAIVQTTFKAHPGSSIQTVSVHQLGTQLMDAHAAAVLVIGVMLTVSLLGSIVLAASDSPKKNEVP